MIGASAKMSVSDNNNSVTSQVDSSQNGASVSVSGKSSALISVESDKSTASSSANTNQASQKGLDLPVKKGDFYSVASVNDDKAKVILSNESGEMTLEVNDNERKITGVTSIENLISIKDGQTVIHGDKVKIGNSSIYTGTEIRYAGDSDSQFYYLNGSTKTGPRNLTLTVSSKEL